MGRVSTCQKNCNTIDLRRAQVNDWNWFDFVKIFQVTSTVHKIGWREFQMATKPLNHFYSDHEVKCDFGYVWQRLIVIDGDITGVVHSCYKVIVLWIGLHD